MNPIEPTEQPQQFSTPAQHAPIRDQRADLIQAVARGDVAEVRRMIAAGVSTSTEQLPHAAARGHTALVQALLADGADVHYRDDAALQRGATRSECLKLLLAAGANVHAQNNGALWEVVRVAYAEGRQLEPRKKLLDCARQLIAAGANPLAAHPGARGDSILEHEFRPVTMWSRRSGRYPNFPRWAGSFVEFLVNSLPPLSLGEYKRVLHVCRLMSTHWPGRRFTLHLTEEAFKNLESQQRANKKRAATRAEHGAAKLETELAHATVALQTVQMPPGYSIRATPDGIIVKGPYLVGAVRELRGLKGKWDPDNRVWRLALRKVDALVSALGRFSVE